MRLTSAHAVAFLALVLAAGGAFAVARDVSPAPGPRAYQLADTKSRLFVAGRPGHQQLINRLVVPAPGAYAVTAKLDIRIGDTSNPPGGTFAGGTLVCDLDSIGRQDTSRLTLSPGDAGEIVLTSVGTAATTTGTTRAIDLTCGSTRSAFVVAAVRITALTLNAFSESDRR